MSKVDPNVLLTQMMKLIQENFPNGMGAAQSVSDDHEWRSYLINELKKNGIEEKPTYSAEASEGSKGFVGTVTVGGQQYTAKETAKNKKGAESAAAKAAFEALYPEAFNKRMAKGQKRKSDSSSASYDNPKYKLSNGVQRMIANASGRGPTKEDVAYVVTSREEKPSYMATVTIPEYEGGKSFSGEWCDTKMKAKNSAAQAAYTAMSDMLTALEEDHAAKKKAKKRDRTRRIDRANGSEKESKERT